MLGRLRQIFSPKETAPVVPPPVFALPEGMRIYAVGDIHGRAKLLAKMMAAVEADAREHPAQKTIQIFLGDYIDRGLESREVVDMLLTTPPEGHERICLMGNHEEALLHFLEDPNILRDWANFGGYATLASYGIPIPGAMTPERLTIVRDNFRNNLPDAHLAFFKNLVLRCSFGDYLFVHAGIHPGVPLEEQKAEHLLWIRESFLRHKGFFAQYVVHGHTPVTAPEIHKNRANLDVTGASINSLCCLIIHGTERHALLVTDSD